VTVQVLITCTEEAEVGMLWMFEFVVWSAVTWLYVHVCLCVHVHCWLVIILIMPFSLLPVILFDYLSDSYQFRVELLIIWLCV